MEARPVSESEVIMTEMVLPTHTNSLDGVFGGTIMSWIDIAAAISAQRHSQLPVVTASIDTLDFIRPIYKGWVVNLRASVNYTGRTSMEVGVRVDSEDLVKKLRFHTASAYLTFVALGSDNLPTEIPPIKPQTAAQIRRHKAAIQRRQYRLKLREAILKDT